MKLLLALAWPALFGVVMLRSLGLRWADDRIAFPAWSWLVGCLGIGAAVQIFLVLRLPPGHAWLLLLALGLAAAYATRRLAGRTPDAVPRPEPAGPGRAFAAFVFVGVMFCLLFVAAGLDRPCIEGDEGNIWSLKAKSLLVDWPDGFAAAQVHNLHPDYPQLNPLLQAWIYAGLGEVDPFDSRWPVQLCSAALFVALAGALRRRLPPLAAAALAALLLLEPEFQNLLRTAYADGMVALGLVVALDAFLHFRGTGDRRFGWLAGLGLAFALWSKNEAMLYVASAGAAAVLTRAWVRPQQGGFAGRNLVLLAPALLVVGNTALWNRHFGLQSDLLGSNPTGKSMFALMAEQWPERVPALLAEAAAVLTSTGHAHVVFAALMLGMALVPRAALGRDLALPVLALLFGFVGLHVVYVGSFLPLRFHLDTSYTRVTVQLLPAALVLVAAIASAVVAARGGGHTAHRP